MNENADKNKVAAVHQNAVILANIIELTCNCIKQVAVSDVADALSDDSLNRDILAHVVAARIKEKLIA